MSVKQYSSMVKQVVGEVAASGTALAIIGIRNKISCAARCQTPQSCSCAAESLRPGRDWCYKCYV